MKERGEKIKNEQTCSSPKYSLFCIPIIFWSFIHFYQSLLTLLSFIIFHAKIVVPVPFILISCCFSTIFFFVSVSLICPFQCISLRVLLFLILVSPILSLVFFIICCFHCYLIALSV